MNEVHGFLRPTYTKAMLAALLGKTMVDADAVHRAMEAESLLTTERDVGLFDRLPAATHAAWEGSVAVGRAEDQGRVTHG